MPPRPRGVELGLVFFFGNARLSPVPTLVGPLMPFPASGTELGLPPPSWLTCSIADRAPKAAGVKVTLTVQPAPPPSVAGGMGQLWVS